VGVVAAAGTALEEGAALVKGALSGKMRVVILEEDLLAYSRKYLMMASFPSSSLAMEELTLSQSTFLPSYIASAMVTLAPISVDSLFRGNIGSSEVSSV
jgi:hypothetical protein